MTTQLVEWHKFWEKLQKDAPTTASAFKKNEALYESLKLAFLSGFVNGAKLMENELV